MRQPLIALVPMTYMTRRLQAGDAFDAVPRDARVLKAIGKARPDYDAPVKQAIAQADTPPPAPPPEEPEPDPLDALRAEAEAAGVKVDGRWGDVRLRDEIEAAKAAHAASVEAPVEHNELSTPAATAPEPQPEPVPAEHSQAAAAVMMTESAGALVPVMPSDEPK